MSRTKTSSAIELLVPLDRASGGRSTASSNMSCVTLSEMAASRPDPRCRRRARWRHNSRSRAGSWSRRTSSWRPRTPGQQSLVARPRSRPAPVRLRRARQDLPRSRSRSTSDPVARTWISSRGDMDAIRPPGAERDAQRAVRVSRRTRHARVADGARRLPRTGSVARPPHPEHIVICSGFSQGLKLVATVLREDGARRVAIEEPSQGEGRNDLRSMGLDVIEIPVDDARLARRPARCRRRRCRRRDRRAPVSDRRRAAGRTSFRARGLGRAARRDGHRGRLRRRVPVRPRADRRDPGAQPGAGRLRRLG